MYDIKSFGNRVKQKRQELNMKQYEFASRIGITPQTLNKYENTNGEKNKMPSFEVIIKIAEQLNVSLDWLCGGGSSNNEKFIQTNNDTKIKPIISNLLSALDTLHKNNIKTSINCEKQEHSYRNSTIITIHHNKLSEFFENYNKIQTTARVLDDISLYNMIIESLINKFADCSINENIIDDVPF